METICSCGSVLHLQLCQLTLAHSTPLVLHHVPVVHCEQCNHSEVYAAVKETLYHVLAPSQVKDAGQLDFEAFSECARYLMMSESDAIPLDECIDDFCDRMDDLLDLLGFAMSAGDREWSEDIQRRLREIHVIVQTVHHFS